MAKKETRTQLPAEQTGTDNLKNTGIYSFKVQAIIVAVLAVLFYCNTFSNEYALDDTIVIVKNEFVHHGFAGIPDILTKDAYYSYYDQLHSSNQLSGGRYRPLSIVTFAIEQQFFGPVAAGQPDSILINGLAPGAKLPYERRFIHEMHVRHIFNVAWYVLAIVALLYFLRSVVFKSDPMIAFIAAILFTIHPLHTEVVANVKSRDELMSLLFICLTFICASKYRDDTSRKWMLVAGLTSYFFAFLSKEYAITLVVLLPLSFYVFNNHSIKKSLVAALPYFGIALLYLIIRLQVLGPRSDLSDNDIQINPYAYASATEKMATIIATSLNYLKLLIWPYPLSSDYSYNQIPYKDFSNFIVWLSLIVHATLAVLFVYFIKTRSVWSFAIGFYLLNLLLVNNFLFSIGATMGERLIFHASVGFVMAGAVLLYKAAERLKDLKVRNGALGGTIAVLVLCCGYETIARNKDWKNDATLFFKDINTVPNSFLVCENVGTMLVNTSDQERDEQTRLANLHRAVQLFTRVLNIEDKYALGHLNRGVAYYKLNEADSMVMDLDDVMHIYPMYPNLPYLYFQAGFLYYNKKDYAKATVVLNNALKLDPNYNDARAALNDVNKAMQATQ